MTIWAHTSNGVLYVELIDGNELIKDKIFLVTEARKSAMMSPSMPIVRALLQHCVQLHGCGLASTGRPQELPKSMILIDVHEGCLVEPSQTVEYAALSYVWGNVGNFETTEANKDLLRQPRALFSQNVPQLIRDVMRLVRDIGQRYLWVDALCIVQDNNKEREEMICHMDAIYGNSYFTIITLFAQDVVSSVPGVCSRRKFPYEVIQEKCFWDYNSGGNLMRVVETSLWATRGWTLQECILSRRRIWISESEIFFDCASQVISEFDVRLKTLIPDCSVWEGPTYPNDQLKPLGLKRVPFADNFYLDEKLTKSTAMELNVDSVRDNRQVIPLRSSSSRCDFLFEYYQQAEEYSSRILSRPQDAVAAFTGITSAWSRSQNWQFSYGMPLQFLIWSLLWTPSSKSSTRLYPQRRYAQAPSWSWMSMNVKVEFIYTFKRYPLSWVEGSEPSFLSLCSHGCDDSSLDSLRIRSLSASFSLFSSRGFRTFSSYSGILSKDTEFHMLVKNPQNKPCGLIWGIEKAWFEPPGENALRFIRLFAGEGAPVQGSFYEVRIASLMDALESASQIDFLKHDKTRRRSIHRDLFSCGSCPNARHPSECTEHWVFTLVVKPVGSSYERVGIGKIWEAAWNESERTEDTFNII